MKRFGLKIFSKNAQSIHWFDTFFFHREKLKKNFKVLKKEKLSSFDIKKITLLAAPHIDKDAQEQFSFKTYTKTYFIYTTNDKKFLKFFKKLKTERFSDIKTTLTCKVQTYNNNFLTSWNNFFLNNFYFTTKNKNKKVPKLFRICSVLNFLKILDLSGEIFFKLKNIFK